jgi:dTDP-4-dehydrorhamnose 3,5-epimerase
MEITELEIDGCYLVKPRIFTDSRGRFVKPVVATRLNALGLRSDFVEQYYSSSAAGVIRGMHFQLPPHQHCKLVYCVAGSVTDVVLDLRKGSDTYGRHLAVRLDADNAHAVYMPAGIAHGFIAMGEPALMIYNVTSEYAPEHDAGIRWNSFGFDWNNYDPIISRRDRDFPSWSNFDSPF